MEQQIFFMVFTFCNFYCPSNDGEVVSGLIFDPIKDEMYFSERNKGFLVISD